MTRPASFDASLVAMRRQLRANALRLTKNPDKADDLVQDTIVRALRFYEHFAEATNLEAWLFTVMRNEFFSRERRGKRMVEDPDGEYAATLYQNAAQEARVGIQDAIAVLAARCHPDHVQALWLRTAGHSLEDVAAVQGVPVGTIKSRVFRARAVLENAA